MTMHMLAWYPPIDVLPKHHHFARALLEGIFIPGFLHPVPSQVLPKGGEFSTLARQTQIFKAINSIGLRRTWSMVEEKEDVSSFQIGGFIVHLETQPEESFKGSCEGKAVCMSNDGVKRICSPNDGRNTCCTRVPANWWARLTRSRAWEVQRETRRVSYLTVVHATAAVQWCGENTNANTHARTHKTHTRQTHTAHARTQAHTRTHTCTSIHTQTHTHIHIHTQTHPLIHSLSRCHSVTTHSVLRTSQTGLSHF